MRVTSLLAAIALTSAVATAPSPAQTTQPAPSLQALDRDMRALYKSTEKHTVRVIVPVRITNLAEQHPLIKWAPQIDPRVLAEAARQQNGRVFVDAMRPVTQPAATNAAQQPPDTARIQLPTQITTTTNVEFAGIILDSSGDVLLPLYIAPDTPMQVTVDDETATMASVVASDELTALSVVKLARPAGEAAAFADAKPADGSLMLVLAPTRRLARLTVWTGTADDNAILVDSAGKFSAIVRNGHALFPSTYLPVVNQLRSGGQVKRAQLGVMIYEVGVDDPIRTKLAALGSRPAARIMQIVPGSAADKGGLQAGDLILQLNDERVEDVATFAAIIANCRGTTTLHILRGETAQTIAVDLQPQ